MEKVKHFFSAEKILVFLVGLSLIVFFGSLLFIPPICLSGIIEIKHLVFFAVFFIPVLSIGMIKKQKRYVVLYFIFLLLSSYRDIMENYNHLKELPIKTGMNIKEVRKIIGQGKGNVIGKKGGLAKLWDYRYSSRKITNFCEYYSWENMSYLLVYIDEKQEAEHVFFVPTQ